MKNKSVKSMDPKVKVEGSEIRVIGGGLVRMFKIGDRERPASEEDIKNFAKNLKKCYKEPGRKLICQHAVCTEVIGQEEAQFLMMLHDKGIISGEELKRKLNI